MLCSFDENMYLCFENEQSKKRLRNEKTLDSARRRGDSGFGGVGLLALQRPQQAETGKPRDAGTG